MAAKDGGGYNLQIVVGDAEPLPGPTLTCAVSAGEQREIVSQLELGGVTPADLRSRSVLVVGSDPEMACAVYAVLLGLSGRFVDFCDSSRFVDATQVTSMARGWRNSGKPANSIPEAQIGRDHPSLPSVGVGAALTAEDISVVSYAKKLRFVPTSDPLVALTQLAVVAAIRQRGMDQRLPLLVSGSAAGVPGEEGTHAPEETLVNLEELRRAGQDLRRKLDVGPAGRTVVEKMPLSERQKNIMSAAKTPMDETLVRLGARKNEQTGLWHCPRPERHTNGDATASMKLSESVTRCFRCDAEKIDPVRITMDTLSCSVDEAADWLVSGLARPAGRSTST